jgi:hypothetical protein
MKTLENRFYEKVAFPRTRDGCWIWQASDNGVGYGQIWVCDRMVSAHRLSYELWYGEPIPDGRQIDHKCHQRACVRPDHLDVVTPRENVSRGLISDMNPKKTSRFRGVSWHLSRGVWVARMRVNGRQQFLGYFTNEQAAAATYRRELRRAA